MRRVRYCTIGAMSQLLTLCLLRPIKTCHTLKLPPLIAFERTLEYSTVDEQYTDPKH